MRSPFPASCSWTSDADADAMLKPSEPQFSHLSREDRVAPRGARRGGSQTRASFSKRSRWRDSLLPELCLAMPGESGCFYDPIFRLCQLPFGLVFGSSFKVKVNC